MSQETENKPKEKNKEELEQERFDSLMDNYLEKRRKKAELEKKAQEEKEKLEQAASQVQEQKPATETPKKKKDAPLNWIFAVD